MLESEFDKWHNKQIQREDALKEVEDKVNLNALATNNSQNWNLMHAPW